MSTTDNLRTALKMGNGRGRMGIFLVVVVICICLGAGYLFISRKSASPAPTGASVSRAPAVPNVPGTSASRQYNQQVDAENKRLADEAARLGKPHVPVLSGTSAIPAPPLEIRPPVVIAPTPSAVQPPRPAPQTVASASRTAQQNDRALQDSRDKAEGQVMGYLALWKPALGTQEFNYTGVEPVVARASSSATESDSVAGEGPPSDRDVQILVRAGTVIPALLITPINSDAPGPVLADIVSGPLAGARMIGVYQAEENQLVVQFKTLSMPGHPKSYQVNVYAVRPDMGSGLATDVNRHTFRRYGFLAAAAFVGGYGEAVGRQNSTVVTGPFGSVTQYDALDPSQFGRAALGRVGTAVGQELGRESRVRPTIKAEGQDGRSLPIGLLFLDDF